MPRVCGWDTLAPAHRAWLQREWRLSGYGQSERIAAELAERLRLDDPDAQVPDQSTVYRWGRAEKARASQIRYAAELRAATIAALPEDDPGLAEKAGAYMEGRIVEALEDLDAIDGLDPSKKIEALFNLAKINNARRKVNLDRERQDLARARWEEEQAIRLQERSKAADAAVAAARGQGLTPEGLAAVRAAIEGAL